MKTPIIKLNTFKHGLPVSPLQAKARTLVILHEVRMKLLGDVSPLSEQFTFLTPNWAKTLAKSSAVTVTTETARGWGDMLPLVETKG